MYIQKHREAGPYAIETHDEIRQLDHYSKFETAELVVVYADKGLPSHCTRTIVWNED